MASGLKFGGWYRTNVFLILSVCKRFLLPFFIVMGLQDDSPNGNGSLCRPYPVATPSRLCCLISPWLPFSITKHFLPLNIYARLFALGSISLHFLRLKSHLLFPVILQNLFRYILVMLLLFRYLRCFPMCYQLKNWLTCCSFQVLEF